MLASRRLHAEYVERLASDAAALETKADKDRQDQEPLNVFSLLAVLVILVVVMLGSPGLGVLLLIMGLIGRGIVKGHLAS